MCCCLRSKESRFPEITPGFDTDGAGVTASSETQYPKSRRVTLLVGRQFVGCVVHQIMIVDRGFPKSRLPESMDLFLACRRSSPLSCWSDLLGESQRFTADSQRDCADSPPLSGACVSPGASGFYRYPKGLTRAGQSSEKACVFFDEARFLIRIARRRTTVFPKHSTSVCRS